MSVIITEINIPNNCFVCDFNQSGLWCNITKSEIDRDYEFSERLNNCPIKSVEGLIEKIEERVSANRGDSDLNVGVTVGLAHAIDIIKEYCEVEE